MPRSTDMAKYPFEFTQLADAFRDTAHAETFEFATRTEAYRFRLDIYGFQGAIKRSDDIDTYYQFTGVRCFVRKGDDGLYYVDLKHADAIGAELMQHRVEPGSGGGQPEGPTRSEQ